MKKVIVGLLTSATIMAISTISLGTTGKVNTDNSRVRSKASADSNILTLLSINEKVEVLGESGDWYKVKADGETGYISKELLDVEDKKETNTTAENTVTESNTENNETSNTKENETQEENSSKKSDKATITEAYVGKLSSEVTVKIIPSINSTNIAKIEKDSQITVVEILNDWCHIETTNYSGWARVDIVEDAISVSSDSEQTEVVEEEQAKETSETKVGYVNVETVNLRKDKDTSSEAIDGITKNTEVTILGEEDGWYKVKVKDLNGYILKKYISDQKVEEVTSRAADSARQIEQSKQSSEEEKTVSSTDSTGDTSATGADVVEFAKKYLGSKYVSGGASPSTGFDCSGFTSYIYSNFGVSLSRASTAQASNGTSVNKSDLEKGDLLIFNDSSNRSVGHVGIYIGNDQFIHAANGSKGVVTTSLSSSYYEERYVDARRVLP